MTFPTRTPPYEVEVINWPGEKGYKTYKVVQIAFFDVGVDGTLGIDVPMGVIWNVIGIVFESDHVGIANDCTISLRILDPNNNLLFWGGAPVQNFINLWTVTFARGLQNTDYNDGQLPPRHYGTQSLPEIILYQGMKLRAVRSSIGGLSPASVSVILFYTEEQVR